jgi:hypothetical protein
MIKQVNSYFIFLCSSFCGFEVCYMKIAADPIDLRPE